MFIISVFALKVAKMNQNFPMAFLEHQFFDVVEQFVADKISLFSGRLVIKIKLI